MILRIKTELKQHADLSYDFSVNSLIHDVTHLLLSHFEIELCHFMSPNLHCVIQQLK